MTADTSSDPTTQNACQQLQADTGWSADTIAANLDIPPGEIRQWLDGNYTPTVRDRVHAEYTQHRYRASNTPISDVLTELKAEMRCYNELLADRLDVTKAAVGTWINEKSRPKVQNLHRIRIVYAGYLTATTLNEILEFFHNTPSITNKEIAANLDASHNAVGNWLLGERNPQDETDRSRLRSLYFQVQSELRTDPVPSEDKLKTILTTLNTNPHLSNKDIAQHMSVNQNAVGDWLQGKSLPRDMDDRRSLLTIYKNRPAPTSHEPPRDPPEDTNINILLSHLHDHYDLSDGTIGDALDVSRQTVFHLRHNNRQPLDDDTVQAIRSLYRDTISE